MFHGRMAKTAQTRQQRLLYCRSAATSPACLQLHDENMLMPDVFIGVAKTYLRQVTDNLRTA